nr:Chain C, MbCpf1 [Moraxella bovoculi]7CI2_D Chain D, MbCpf1 [Moraxella bovoculi]
NTGKSVYQKMIYKLLPGPNKMLPKVFFAKSNLD